MFKLDSSITAILGVCLFVVIAGIFFAPRASNSPVTNAPVVQQVTTQMSGGAALPVDVPFIGRNANDLPPPITRSESALVKVDLTAEEVVSEIMPGVTYTYWTFNRTVPGPFIRAKEGDDVEVTLYHGAKPVAGMTEDLAVNFLGASGWTPISVAHADAGHAEGDPHMSTSGQHAAEGHGTHSVDLHSVYGPGGGAMIMQVGHDGPKTFRFKALRPGIYVYHCASPHIPTHIANGMYGLILVEPKEGMAAVDREFYVMQGELYTSGKFGELGHQSFSKDKLLAEAPEYFMFNGRVGGVVGDRAMRVKVGEKVRLFVGVGSHIASNFHIIGGILDKLYPEGDIISPPHRNVQTTLIPAGGAAMIEFTPEVPGTYLIVDHSLTRSIDKGAVGQIIVEGDPKPDLFRPIP